jgi:uncharacterized protein
MATSFKDALLAFIVELRGAGVRISVAESLDAMHAVAAAGLERARMREALRAALIKDEADNTIFDAMFARCFAGLRPATGQPRQSKGAYIGVSGSGGGSGAVMPVPSSRMKVKPEELAASAQPSSRRDSARQRQASKLTPSHKVDENRSDESAVRPPQEQDAKQSAAQANKSIMEESTGEVSTSTGETGSEAGRARRLHMVEQRPFATYSDLEYEQAREALAVLKRRLRIRLGRRMRLASRGRIDFRRTIRAAIQRGGAFADLRFRARRPRHIDLLILADISGSVKYASTLMLDLVAGARRCFHKVKSFVYIHRLAEAEFEQGHLVMTPVLDLYARSDFGRVLSELLEKHSQELNRATVVAIMGDGRNNRRPARAELLREIARRCRAVVWLNPEPPERWGSGDSAIAQYEREIDVLVACGNLHQLESALGRVAFP